MRRRRVPYFIMKIFAGALVLALAVQGATLAQSSSPQPMGSTQGGGAVTLVPAGKKGPSGSAVLSQQGANLTVTVQLPQAYQVGGKAMISPGTCSSTGAATMTKGTTYALTISPGSGPSQTTLTNLSLETLTSSPHIIVVQGTPALCGDVSTLLPPQKP